MLLDAPNNKRHMTTIYTTDPTTATNGTQTRQCVFRQCFNKQILSAPDELALLMLKLDQPRFGFCFNCDCGLYDEEDFVVTGNAMADDTLLLCYQCFTCAKSCASKRSPA
jgi:hypothetical protein